MKNHYPAAASLYSLAESLLSKASDGMLLTTAGSEPTICYANESFTAMSGWPAADILGKPAALLGHEDRDAFDTITTAIAALTPLRTNIKLACPNRPPLNVAVSLSLVPGEDGTHTLWNFGTPGNVAAMSAGRDNDAVRQAAPLVDTATQALYFNQDVKRLFDALPFPIFVKNNRSAFILLNDACERQWGSTTEAVRGTTGLGPFTQAQVDNFIAEDREVFDSRQAAQFEEPIFDVTLQESRTVHTFKHPIFGPKGEPQYIVGAMLDISERKQTEARFMESEGKLQGLLQMSRLGFVLTTIRGEYVELNDAFCRITGYPRSELLGMDHKKLTPPEYWEADRLQLEALAAQGQFGPHEKEYIRRDGERIFVQNSGTLLTGRDGHPYIWVVIEDITARKRQLETIEQLAGIVETSLDAIIGFDEKSRILSWNPAAETMFGFTAAEAIGQHASVLTSGMKGQDRAFIASQLTAGLPLMNLSLSIRRKDGVDLAVMASIWPTRAKGGRVIGASMIAHDMTERNRIELELRQAQKMEAIGNLSGGLAHDFNNLLGVIIGNLDMVVDNLGTTGNNRILVANALAAAERGAELTRSLLAFARRHPLQPKPMPLDPFLVKTMALLSRLLGEHIKVSIDLAATDCWVTVDAGQLSAAMANLVTNARDAMSNSGTISIRSSIRHAAQIERPDSPDTGASDFVVIEVSDTGPGIPPDIITRIFDPFFTTKGREGGSGLGLSMVFGFAKQSGGDIEVVSEAGHGATFRILLPIAVAAEGEDEIGPESGPTKGHGEAILLVEDNALLRETIGAQLVSLGYRVFKASDGREALASLETTPVDLIFSDVMLAGGIDGVELTNRVSQQWPETGIVLTSGFPEVSLGTWAPTQGAQFLAKPYRRDVLARTLREVLDSSGRKSPRPANVRTPE